MITRQRIADAYECCVDLVRPRLRAAGIKHMKRLTLEEFRDYKTESLQWFCSGLRCPVTLLGSFLKNLILKYKEDDLKVISIETFNRNSIALETYRRRNSIPYTFLLSTDEVTNNYQVQLVPAFFLLDSDRIIRKVITALPFCMKSHLAK